MDKIVQVGGINSHGVGGINSHGLKLLSNTKSETVALANATCMYYLADTYYVATPFLHSSWGNTIVLSAPYRSNFQGGNPQFPRFCDVELTSSKLMGSVERH